ncbi:MAG: ABC transporter permease [Acidobacteria bacterium]|nr:ABC transporter permease [Acidobacteriota bacterium]MCA1611162.1 ABC transporter permease [Acidobacteriota bacterium]
MPLELEVALAYLRARPSRLVSSVSLLSIAGIGLGVAALVVAMGLLSGYRTEIREKLIGSNAEVVVFPLTLPSGGNSDTEAAERRIAAVRGVRAVAPVIYQAGVASSASTPDGADAILKGVDPARERAVSEIDAYLPDAEAALTRGGTGVLPGIAIGTELARRLDVRSGDAVTLGVPDRARDTGRLSPRFGQFRVTRIFRTNFAEYDSEWVFLDRTVLRALCRLESPADVIEVRLAPSSDVGGAARAIEKAAGRGFSVTDWRSMNGGLFSALALQQTTLFLVIGLIVAVSTFNVVATLVMTVQEKKRDIGVLATLGAEPRFFSRVFVWLGALLGGSGVLAGILFGALVCWAATTFRLLSFPPGVAEIYFVSFIPFLVRGIDLLAIVGFAALAILIASWLPARRASRIDIAEALRYE